MRSRGWALRRRLPVASNSVAWNSIRIRSPGEKASALSLNASRRSSLNPFSLSPSPRRKRRRSRNVSTPPRWNSTIS